jgi:tetratricopeptide (TPR) repeat protein
MRWQHLEYVLKGIYLGLLLFVAFQEPSWHDVGLVAGCMLAGLVVCLGLAGLRKQREGYRVQGRWFAFVLFLLLESPSLVYIGILTGLALSALLVRHADQEALWGATVGGGAVLGLAFALLGRIRHRWARFGVILGLTVAVAGGVVYWLESEPGLLKNGQMFGATLFVGIPFFYLLTFAGRAEESEVEIAAMCAALALGAWLMKVPPGLPNLALMVPFLLYIWYVTRVLPGLRVFKHALRGHSYFGIGRHRDSLRSFRRALELSPNNKLARDGLWAVHRNMDLTQVANDPEMLAMVDFDLCRNRVAALLMQKPSDTGMKEACHLLDLLDSQRPVLQPLVQYWRAVAMLHQRDYGRAADLLTGLLDPTRFGSDNPQRQAVLFDAWQLALMGHSEMQRRVGGPQLEQPGRRMEAIAAVERRLAANAEDAGAWDMKRLLYGNLTEAEYRSVAPEKPVTHFDYAYTQQLGLALINDTGRWQRGAEFLRIAAHGLQQLGPSIFVLIAEAHEKAGDSEGAYQNYQLAQRAGRAFGPKNLSPEDQVAFFKVVKSLGDTAAQRGDLDTAIDNYHLYTEFERSGLETLRTLAGLYERKGDPASVLNALRVTEHALIYDGSDKDLLERKDRYYISVMPNDLKPKADAVRNLFDVAYCLRKAKAILDGQTKVTNSGQPVDQEMVDWALHLADLAQVMEPKNVSAMVLRARARLLRSERDDALVILEDLREQKPESFKSDDDAEAWYTANRMLGNLYLNELARPDLAILCFNEFRKSSKSGADTLYRLGQAHEAAGDLKKAERYYEQVTAYEGHPLAPDARDALYRLRSATSR